MLQVIYTPRDSKCQILSHEGYTWKTKPSPAEWKQKEHEGGDRGHGKQVLIGLLAHKPRHRALKKQENGPLGKTQGYEKQKENEQAIIVPKF